LRLDSFVVIFDFFPICAPCLFVVCCSGW
jgi:hypothetical protein